MDPVSFGRIWPETVAALRHNYDLLLPVAGFFLFLPQLVFSWHLGDRVPQDLFAGDQLFGDIVALFALIVASLIGQLVIAFVSLNDGTGDKTLGGVLKGALLLLPPALAASMIQGLAVGAGLMLLIVPGLWLLARLSPTIPLIAGGERDPLQAITASWQLTAGRSLKILGMLTVLLLGFLMLSIGITGLGSAVGVITTLATGKAEGGWGIARWLFELMAAGASALFGAAYMAFLSVLTRTLKAHPAEVN